MSWTDQSLHWRSLDIQVLTVSAGRQSRLIRCVHALDDLSLRRQHMSKVYFVIHVFRFMRFMSFFFLFYSFVSDCFLLTEHCDS